MKIFKGFQKLLALTASAVLLAFLPGTLTASAEEPVTYYVMYSERDEDWRYQTGSEWDNEAQSRESYYLHEKIKDGDIVIVGNGGPLLTLNVRLSNLTICNTTEHLAMVAATGGIDNCYFTNGTRASITGDVANAHVHGGSTANFNNNVSNLYSYQSEPDIGPTIGVSGKVACFKAVDSYEETVAYSGTDFAADSFSMVNGVLKTDSAKYTKDSGDPVSPNGQNTPQATPAPTAAPASDEYDAVPKTGEVSPAIWLSLAAAVCLGLGLALRRPAK